MEFVGVGHTLVSGPSPSNPKHFSVVGEDAMSMSPDKDLGTISLYSSSEIEPLTIMKSFFQPPKGSDKPVSQRNGSARKKRIQNFKKYSCAK